MTTEDACSDCGRPKKAYADGCCAAELTGYDDECAPLTIAKLRAELATRRTWKVDEATAAELARLNRELARARELGKAEKAVVEAAVARHSLSSEPGAPWVAGYLALDAAIEALLALRAKQGGE